MNNQNIYGVISDDKAGVRGSTSSNRGKVSKVTLWVNTDKLGEATLNFNYDESSGRITVDGKIPKEWQVAVKRTGEMLKKVM